jgi:hypothetical protein
MSPRISSSVRDRARVRFRRGGGVVDRLERDAHPDRAAVHAEPERGPGRAVVVGHLAELEPACAVLAQQLPDVGLALVDANGGALVRHQASGVVG